MLRIGDILVRAGLISEKQLEIALAEQKRTGGRLGEVLAQLGVTNEEAISRALAKQSGVEHVDLEQIEIDVAAVRRVSEGVARRLNAIPIRIERDTLVVAMSNPTDIVAIDEVQRRAHLFVRVVSTGHRQLLRTLDRVYDGDASQERTIDWVVERALTEVGGDGDEDRGGVVALMDELLSMAIRRDATDVHIQPGSVVRIRLRIDGDLNQGTTLKRSLLAPLVARVKVMAGLDISETRIPQDGKIRFAFDTGVVDMRVATFPTIAGESVVIRVLDKDKQVFNLQSLGLDSRERKVLMKAAKRPNGLVLAVGPTGSGKSTTLYALLKSVNATRRKIITLEDPVEYELPLVTQCQINEKAGVTFATGLRAILRHDPDVVLVGEMRDRETAQLALRAALTGHLVFSTLHTNDSVRTVTRLFDMELDGYIVSSCLAAIAAQRLVRRICPHCKEAFEPSAEEIEAVGLAAGTKGSFARGRGCDRCGGTGNRGREALFEVLEVTPAVAQLISRKAPVVEIEKVARDAGLVTFRELAQRRAIEGRISLDEVAAVTTEP